MAFAERAREAFDAGGGGGTGCMRAWIGHTMMWGVASATAVRMTESRSAS